MEPLAGASAPERANWISGSWRPASAGQGFSVDSLVAPFGPRGDWPRSTAADVDLALAAGHSPASEWARMGSRERAELLTAALDRLEEAQGLAEALSAGLGLDPVEARELLHEDFLRGREGLELVRESSAPTGAGLGIFQAHWSDLAGSLLGRLAARLLGGSTAVVLADPRLPEAAEAVARALEAAGLPPGVANLVFDDGLTCLRAALGSPGLAWVRLRGLREDLDQLSAMWQPGAFGAGLTQWTMWPLSSSVLVVASASDPAAEAQRVVERGLSPSATLCGQLPDRIGRVLCHQRQLSRFTEELLARLEERADIERPRPLVEPRLLDWLGEAWALGLDEGAAPILGEAPIEGVRRPSQARGQPAQATPGPAAGTGMEAGGRPSDEGEGERSLGEQSAGERGGGRPPRSASPVVFTNVEAGGRLLRLERPAPLLRLVRVASDDEAHALRRALES